MTISGWHTSKALKWTLKLLINESNDSLIVLIYNLGVTEWDIIVTFKKYLYTQCIIC
jgi:hypothetical protein